MAKKHHDLEDGDWELPGLDDFDDLFGEEESESQQSRLRRFTTGFRRGFLGGLVSENNRDLVMEASLPDGYMSLINEGRRFRSFTQETREAITRENASSLLNITEQAKRHLPRLKRRLSDKRYQRIEDAIQARQDQLRAMVDSSRGGATEATERERENQSLAEMLASLQASDHVTREANAQERADQESLEEGVRDQVEAGRFELTHEILTDIRNAQNRQVAYQDGVAHQISKRGLEIQFRSLFMLRDMRRLAGAQLALSRNAFEAVIHNTSLPSHAKRKHAVSVLDSQQFDQLISGTGIDPTSGRNSMFRREQLGHALTLQASQFAGNSLQEYLRNYGPQIRNNLVAMATRGIQGVDSGLSSAEMVGDLAGMGDRYSTAGGIAGGAASNWAVSRLAPRIGERLKPHTEALSERLGGRQHLLNYWLANAPSVMQDFINDPEQSFGWRGALQNLARGVFPTFGLDGKLTDGGYHTIEQDSSFNHLTQRSIVEIIPGYLSRILHEIRVFRTGDESLEREVYDVTSGRFTGMSKAQSRLKDVLFSPNMRETVGGELDRVVQAYDPEGQLSDEARYALRDRLMRDAATGDRFAPEKYIQAQGYDDQTSTETLDELENFFRGRFQFNFDDTLVRESDNLKRLQDYSREFLRLKDVIPDTRETIQRLYGTGSQETMRDLGLIRNELGQDYIDFPNLWSIYRGVGERGVGPTPEPDEPPSITDYLKDDAGRLKEWFRENRPEEVARLEALRDRVGERKDDVVKRVSDYVERSGISEQAEALQKRAGSTITKLQEQWEDRTSENLGHLAGDRSPEARARIMAELKRRADSSRRRSEFERLKTDLFTRDNLKNPKVTYQKLKEGHYFDAETGQLIETWEDIKGRVVDRFNNTVLTTQDLKDGLVDQSGRHFDSLREHIDRFAESETVQNLQARARPLVSRLRNRVVDTFQKIRKDIFVEGEDQPRLRIADFIRGRYFDRETGDPIKSPEDIKGPVTDQEGNELLSGEELQKTVTAEGDPHPVRKNRSLLNRLARGYWNLTKRYYGWLGGKALGAAKTFFNIGRKPKASDSTEASETTTDRMRKLMFGEDTTNRILGDSPADTGEESNRSSRLPRGFRWLRDEKREVNSDAIRTPTDGLLTRMLDLLDRRLPAEGPRRGSWQEQFARRGEEGDEDGSDSGGTQRERAESRGFMDDLKDLLPGAGILNSIKETFSGGGGAAAGAAAGAAGGSLLGKATRVLGRGVKGLGRLGWGGAKWLARGAVTKALPALGKGALALGSGLVSAVGWPVILGAAAVGTAAYGGYRLWDRYQTRKGAVQRLRLAQYGIDPDDITRVRAILSVEEMFVEHSRLNEGQVVVDTEALDLDLLADAFGLEEDTTDEQMQQWNTWMVNRFNPVLLAHMNAWHTHSPGSDFHDLDDDLDGNTGADYLDDVMASVGEDPYSYLGDPFGSEEPLTGRDQVDVYLAEAREEFQRTQASSEFNATNTVVAAQTGLTQDEQRRATRQREAGLSQSGDLDGGTAQRTGVAPGAALAIHSRGNTQLNHQTGGHTLLQQLRLHTYGVERLDSSITSAILTIEDALYPRLTWEDGKASYQLSPRAFFDEFGVLLGVSHGQRDYGQWAQWARQRFIPVLMEYVTSLRRVAPNARLANPESVLDRFTRASVARSVFATPEPRTGDSIFTVGLELPRHNGDTAHLLAEAVMDRLESLEQASETESQSAAQGAPDPQRGGGSTQGPQTPLSSMSTDPAMFSGGRRAGAGGSVGGGMDAGVRYLGGGQVGGFGVGPNSQPYQGQGVGDFSLLSGTGGVWEEIPEPAGEGKAHAAPTLQAVEGMTGIDWVYLFALAGVESGWRFNVGPDTSSALGWYQFIQGTWTKDNGSGVFDRFAGRYGIPRPENKNQRLALRRDPRIAALMAAEFTKENYNYLKQQLSRELSYADLYLAHFLGMGGAKNFLKELARDGSRLGVNLSRSAADANPTVFFHGGRGGRPKTLAEIYEWVNQRIASCLPDGVEATSQSSLTPEDVPDPNSHHAPSVWDGSGMEAVNLMQTHEVRQVAPADLGSGAYALVPRSEDAVGGTEGSSSEPTPPLSDVTQSSIDPVTSNTPTHSSASVEGPLDPSGGVESDGLVDDPVVAAQEYRRQQSQIADTQQRHRTEAQAGETQAMGTVAQQQLEVQREMREYLRTIAERFSLIQNEGLRIKEPEGGTTNDTSRPVEPTTPANPPRSERTVGSSSPSLRMSSQLGHNQESLV